MRVCIRHELNMKMRANLITKTTLATWPTAMRCDVNAVTSAKDDHLRRPPRFVVGRIQVVGCGQERKNREGNIKRQDRRATMCIGCEMHFGDSFH